jgi:hypothetical protein
VAPVSPWDKAKYNIRDDVGVKSASVPLLDPAAPPLCTAPNFGATGMRVAHPTSTAISWRGLYGAVRGAAVGSPLH